MISSVLVTGASRDRPRHLPQAGDGSIVVHYHSDRAGAATLPACRR